jgi:transcriptional antiterminator RfaH
MSWCVVQTKTQSEEKALLNLRQQGFEVYLPRYSKEIRHARKAQTVLRPLFPGYLFIKMDLEKARWRSVNGTIGVITLLQSGDRPCLLADAFIDQLHQRENDHGIIMLEGNNLKIGDKIRLTSGVFAEFTGLLQERKDYKRIILLLNLLGRDVRVMAQLDSVVRAS